MKIRRFQPDQPLARAACGVGFSGFGEPGAEDLELDVTLSLPAGVGVVKSNVAKPLRINSSEGWSRLTWSLEAAEPLAADMVLELKAMNGGHIAHQPLRMLFLPPVEDSRPPYIPEPVPAPTSMLVGAHHCPLWEADKPQMWLNVLKHPERTPAPRILLAGKSGGVRLGNQVGNRTRHLVFRLLLVSHRPGRRGEDAVWQRDS